MLTGHVITAPIFFDPNQTKRTLLCFGSKYLVFSPHLSMALLKHFQTSFPRVWCFLTAGTECGLARHTLNLRVRIIFTWTAFIGNDEPRATVSIWTKLEGSALLQVKLHL